MFRKFHSSTLARRPVTDLFKSVSKVWTRAPADTLSPKALLASQTLRESLDSNTNIRPAVLDLVSQLPQTASYPRQIYSLLDKSLDSGQLQAQDLVKIFQTIVKSDPKGKLNSKLFIKIHKLPKIDSRTHIHNAILYFEWLLSTQSPDQAVKFIQGVQKQHEFQDDDYISVMKMLADSENTRLVPTIFTNLSTLPSSSVIQAAYLHITDANDKQALEELTTSLLHTDPDLAIDRAALIVMLDSHISLEVDGKRILPAALAQITSNENLEFLELLLMACMHFNAAKSTGESLVAQILIKEDMVKETWDLLLQWDIYSSAEIQSIIEKVQNASHDADEQTLAGLIRVADIARRPESDITSLRQAFKELGIETNSDAYSVIINRCINAVELEKARQLFLQSVETGADWTAENDRYAPVLSRLLVEICKSSTIDDNIKFDTYQRIRMVSNTNVSYAAQVEMLKMFLYRDSTSDLAKYLIEQWGETPSLPWSENKEIFSSFMDRILSSGDYRMAWELYRIFNTTISLPYESYMPVQKKFCSLGRPDAAHLIFRHLRNRAKKEGIQAPGREMYLMLFVEYGKWQYEEGMTELDTYFRMDLNNDLDIDIMNSMLLGYSCLSDSPKVRDLWYETNSFAKGKGFNNLTATILLKHLAPISLEAVDDLWQEIPSRYGIQPNEDNLVQYLIANCYHGFYSRALEIVQQAPELYGIAVTPQIISTVYNWTLIDSRKQSIKEWAQEEYPQAWKQLESSGELKNILIEANTDNDSQESIRYNAIQKLKEQTAGPMLRALHKTTDDD